MRSSPQALVLMGALLVWAMTGVSAIWAGVAAYALAWFVLDRIAGVRPGRFEARLSTWALGGIAVCALPVLMLGESWPQWQEGERLDGLAHHLSDRLRLHEMPAIAPPVVATDQPQTFFVHATEGSEVRVRFGSRGATLAADDLGAGLYRVDYDPRRDGAPHAEQGPSTAVIFVDGVANTRSVRVVRPRAHPRWLRPANDRMAACSVSEETDEVFVVGAGGLIMRAATGDGPTDCVLMAHERVVVSHRYGDTLWVLSVPDGRVMRRVRLGPGQVRLASSGVGALAVAMAGAEPGVRVLDYPSMQSQSWTPLPVSPDWLAFGLNDDTLVVSTRSPAQLLRIRRSRGEIRALELGRPAVTLESGSALLWLATTGYGGPHYGNHFVQDQLLGVDVSAWRVVEQRLSARRSPRQSGPGNVDQGVSPMGIDVVGDTLHVAFAGTDEIWRWTDSSPQMLATGEIIAPHGIAVMADGTRIVTSPAAGAFAWFRPDGEETILRLEPSDAELLREDPDALQVRLGEHTFYESTRAGISCQSCHLHADTDFAMRNIGQRRLAPTLTVRGLAGTSPYLRDASYGRIRDLDHLSQDLFRGYLRRAPGRGLNLEAYVQALPRPSVSLARDDARVRRGVTAFRTARCPTCHAFPAFTSLGQHALGSLFGSVEGLAADVMLDTPSLLSVSTHPPYLTDGRAADLAAVLEDHDPLGRHGDLAQLDDEARADLVYFLETL